MFVNHRTQCHILSTIFQFPIEGVFIYKLYLEILGLGLGIKIKKQYYQRRISELERLSVDFSAGGDGAGAVYYRQQLIQRWLSLICHSRMKHHLLIYTQSFIRKNKIKY